MRVRIDYTVDVDDAVREAIRYYYTDTWDGTKASREEVAGFFATFGREQGTMMVEDIFATLDKPRES